MMLLSSSVRSHLNSWFGFKCDCTHRIIPDLVIFLGECIPEWQGPIQVISSEKQFIAELTRSA